MTNIPKLYGFEYTKVQSLDDDQKSLAIQALGYALAEHGLWKDGTNTEIVIKTFVSFLNRGEIL